MGVLMRRKKKKRGVIAKRGDGGPAIMPAQTREHYTPSWLVKLIADALGGPLDLDPCGAPEAIVEAKTIVWLPEHAERWTRSGKKLPRNVAVGDGLAVKWLGRVFVNPPYGTGPLNRWIPCAEAWGRVGGNAVAMLIPAATSRRAWQSCVSKAAVVCFLAGRVKFGGLATGAGFSSAVVLWTPDTDLALRFAATMRRAGQVMFNP